MTQVLWYGRGGQGAFTAARLLGAAYALSGNYALAFPSFGPERRGAPMRAFTKLDTKPIVSRSEVKNADFTVILDDTLYDGDFGAGTVLVATREIYALAERLKLPTVNTIMLGQLAAKLGVTPELLDGAIETVMPERLWERNKNAIRATIPESR
ncbi:MAG: 2-oxoacid:acceptor oxidoreductase family protein [Oscillospiraceae bacterium]|jgi:pyruvate ferredoxin oxidoreductase gamma subunit|nr:2-oxoacid:acceptor oxidoreductase family protein [Oscillospiraceae bacterium]